MKSEDYYILGELTHRSKNNKLIARRLFADWTTWELLKDEFVRQVCENSGVAKDNILIHAEKMNVEI
jgi:hypothetical protein